MLASIIIPTPTRTIQIWKHDYLVHSFHLENSHGRENFAGRGNSDGGHGGGHSSLSSGRGSPSPNQKNNRGRGNTNSSTRPICQVCNKTGHSTPNCYHRYDHSYSSDSSNMHALLTTPQTPSDLNWYLDLGASHHLAADLAHLNVKADEYRGPNQIRIGDGLGLTVKHIGST